MQAKLKIQSFVLYETLQKQHFFHDWAIFGQTGATGNISTVICMFTALLMVHAEDKNMEQLQFQCNLDRY